MRLPPQDSNADSAPPDSMSQSLFLVCGLDGLGQYCAAILKEFGVKVCAITTSYPTDWEVSDLPDQLDHLVIGDYRHDQILEQAQIQSAQAILLVATDEPANIEAAFTARLLNPNIRIVIRSAKHNLNALITQSLGNVITLEPNQLAASACALAAVGGETQAIFQIENEVLRVVQTSVNATSLGLGRPLHDFRTPLRHILTYQPQPFSSSQSTAPPQSPGKALFFNWDPDQILAIADQVTYIHIQSGQRSGGFVPHLSAKISNPNPSHSFNVRQIWQQYKKVGLSPWTWVQQGSRLWQRIMTSPNQRLVVLVVSLMLILSSLGTTLYQRYYPHISLLEAFHTTISLLLGGYGDVFGGVELDFKAPIWLHFFSLGLALIGTAFVGILYAVLTESLLSARLKFLQRRPSIPRHNHMILIGLEDFGQKVGALVQELRQPLVGIHHRDLDIGFFETTPIIVGHPVESLSLANLATAKSVLVVTDDELTNLEVGLAAHASNPEIGLVIRMFDQRFSQTLQHLLPYAKFFCTHALAAEAFAGSAFGENILGLFRLNEQTILVTEYYVEDHDTLQGKLLAQVAYGYDVLPILHQKKYQALKWFPSDDLRLEVGDRLVVLATISSLQRVERGTIFPPTIQVHIQSARNASALFEAANILSRICDCPRSTAQTLLMQLPAPLPMQLYPHQAQRLVDQLRKVLVHAVICS